MVTSKKAQMLLLLTVALLLLFLFNPAVSSFYPPCIFKRITGYYCQGCGSLRALHNLLHGDFAAAVKMNFLLTVTLPLIVVNSVINIRNNKKIFSLQPPFNSAVFVCIVFFIAVLFAVGRNIPHYPFNLLAPH